jgi:hypothetical protein
MLFRDGLALRLGCLVALLALVSQSLSLDIDDNASRIATWATHHTTTWVCAATTHKQPLNWCLMLRSCLGASQTVELIQ